MVKPILLVAVIALFAFASPAWAEQSLSFQDTKWDFGKTLSTDKKRHLFKFTNKGKKPLKITRVTPSCGCTAVVTGNPWINPGGRSGIKVEFDPSGLKGHHESTVLVTADDGSEVVLTVFAEVETAPPRTIKVTPPRPIFKVTPTSVDLGRMKEGEVARYNLVVENAGEGDLFLINLRDADETGLPLNRKPIGKGKRVEITFFYNALGKGPVDDSVLIQTNDPDHPSVKIKLKGFVE